MKLGANESSSASRATASRPKVLLLAYSISPVRGSEYAVGWNHVSHLAEFCDLTVLYGLAGPHMGDLEEIEDHIRTHGDLANVRFVPIRPNRLARLLNAPNRAGVLVYTFYLAYRVWHWQAARIAAKIIASEQIDLIHYLCPIGYREPSYLWALSKPLVWGPIGALVPTLQLKGAPRPWRAVAKVKLKNLANRLNLALSCRVRRALRRADTIVAATSENADMLSTRFAVTPLLIQENAIPDDAVRAHGKLNGAPDRPARLIWIGSLDWRKSPDLLLDVLAAVRPRDWTLDLIGSGALLALAQARAAELGLGDRIAFHAQIPRAEVQQLLREADLHIITSMGEGNPTTIWEAMAAGVPTLTLDHCGMHDVVCDVCGVRVTPTDYVGTRDSVAAEIGALIEDRRKLSALAEGVTICRERFLWSKRSRQWLGIYHGVMARHRHTHGQSCGAAANVGWTRGAFRPTGDLANRL
ncbi:glycosyltransferase family 4 protein [Sphingobium baderi]|uniref:glycosyltransferase family 4 protein n=1 Tax=Sphingobium baderi TaxID=1332080 RepID=UPI002B41077B|nr:glycosyltransferase [Sphingobium baderi]WRD78821.1 glycosyltransferase [Sphingobium baderi]